MSLTLTLRPITIGLPIRSAVRFAVRSVMRIVGRSAVYRCGRLLMSEARFDVPNDPSCNGETMVQASVLKHQPQRQKLVVFDIGANIGNWTEELLRQISDNVDFEIHAFEPCSGTYKILADRIRQRQRGKRVKMVLKACSSSAGTARLHIVHVGAGTNSLTCADGSSSVEQVELTSIDEYCNDNEIDHVTLAKIDTEGHDMEVIRGASHMLHRQAIEVLQFEYNQRWIFGNSLLRDAFTFLNPLGYAIGKVTPHGIEFYANWEWELETFREGNYLACREDWVSKFHRITPTWNRALLAKTA